MGWVWGRIGLPVFSLLVVLVWVVVGQIGPCDVGFLLLIKPKILQKKKKYPNDEKTYKLFKCHNSSK